MMVPSRRVGESIVIGDGMMVTTLPVDGQRVRLGIKALEFVPIRREDLNFDPVAGTGSIVEVNQWRQGRAVPSTRKSR